VLVDVNVLLVGWLTKIYANRESLKEIRNTTIMKIKTCS